MSSIDQRDLYQEQFYTALQSNGIGAGEVTVTLSNEILGLLSDHLYQSPLKAIEELIVNSFDAGASRCDVFVPAVGELSSGFIAVFDDGTGMDEVGLQDLWHVGHSKKRESDSKVRLQRKQIGKFGIGKLATRSVATHVTYVSRSESGIYGVTLDYGRFSEDDSGQGRPVKLPIYKIEDWPSFLATETFRLALTRLGITDASELSDLNKTWTLVVLERLRAEKSIHLGRLGWVLSTAMPLGTDFQLRLNGSVVESSKADYEPVIHFEIKHLPEGRVKSIAKSTLESWKIENGALTSPTFPNGITGTVEVTEESLHGGKSADLGRSHGFFVQVHKRLINEKDPLFGLKPLSYSTFNRFRAVINVDDLDTDIRAPREGVQASIRTQNLEKVLNEVFLEARDRWEKREIEELKNRKQDSKQESERNYIHPGLVEQPVADVLASHGYTGKGSEADGSWFYLEVGDAVDLPALIQNLYSQPRAKFGYTFAKMGRIGRMVQFVPEEAKFYLNEDHDLVRAYSEDTHSRRLLEDLATAEVLLETYLREVNIPPYVVGQVLEKRDSLFRGLAKDHLFSLEAIGSFISESGGEENDLEIGLIAAARALGFTANHVSNAGEPDGIATFNDYSSGKKTIILEAKSSQKVPALSAIDFAGLAEHVQKNNAHGCLLVAPAYPGTTKEENSAAANRAKMLKISCWTTEQLAQVVRAAERRRFNASSILDIVLSAFSPDEVTEAIQRLMGGSENDRRSLYLAIIEALRQLEVTLPMKIRTIDHIETKIYDRPEFKLLPSNEIDEAVEELSRASQGLMVFRKPNVNVFGSLDELERRLYSLLRTPGSPRRLGGFRSDYST